MIHPREQPELKGHEKQKREFMDAFTENRGHHAWLFSGPQGIGKATFAYHMARFLIAPHQNKEVFHQIAAQSHPDFKAIEASDKQIPVESIRQLNHFLSLSRVGKGYRVALVDGIEYLSPSAANALLKKLEEPPAFTVFLLIAHDPSLVLLTLRSRCRFLGFSPIPSPKGESSLDALCSGRPGLQLDDDFRSSLESLLAHDSKINMSFINTYGESHFDILKTLLSLWSHGQALKQPHEKKWLLIWDKVQNLYYNQHAYNLDKKHTLFCVLNEMSPR